MAQLPTDKHGHGAEKEKAPNASAATRGATKVAWSEIQTFLT